MDVINIDTSQSKDIKIKSRYGYTWLIVLIWTHYTVIPYIFQILRSIPIVSIFVDFLYPALLTISTIIALPYMLKYIKKGDFIFYVSGVLIFAGTFFLYPDNSEYLKAYGVEILSAILMIFVGLSFDFKRHKKLLFLLSLLGVVVTFLYQFYYMASGRELMEDNMGTAYNILPSAAYLIYYAFLNKKLKYWLCALLGIFLELLFGTRGVILCIAIFLIIGIYVSIMNSKNIFRKLFFWLIAGIIILGLTMSNTITNVARWLTEIFEKLGFSTRIFDFYLEGNITEDSGRDEITQKILEAINDKMILGHGLMGDWVIVDSYTHNLFLEIWCHFGVIIGTILLVALMLLLMKGVRACPDIQIRLFILMLISIEIPKLMVSSSYLLEIWLFFLIGLCFRIIRQKGCAKDNGIFKENY